MLRALQPLLADRSCDHCQRYLYDEETSTPTRDDSGQMVLRIQQNPPPCRTHRGCMKGTPEAQRSWSLRNWQAYMHYLECEATGQWPDDPIVMQNARYFRLAAGNALAQHRWLMRHSQQTTQELLLAIARRQSVL